MTFCLLILSAILRGPFELATNSVLPDLDFLGGLMSGNVMISIPFLLLTFIFSPLALWDQKSTTTICVLLMSVVSSLSQTLDPFMKRPTTESDTAG
jgi:hypothetical protein